MTIGIDDKMSSDNIQVFLAFVLTEDGKYSSHKNHILEIVIEILLKG